MRYDVTVKYDYGDHVETFAYGPNAQEFASIMRGRPFVAGAEITTDCDDIEANAKPDESYEQFNEPFGVADRDRNYGGLW